MDSTWSMDFGSLPDPLPSKQSSWDRPGGLLVKALVESSLSSATQRATSLAAHSVDWLLAMPIISCGLRLDDEAVRVAVGLRSGLNLGIPHICRCDGELQGPSLLCMQACT